MKKIIIAILSVYYLAVACGITVNFHFCMGHLASVELFAKTQEKCGRCGMEVHKSNGCCHDEVEVVKLAADQQKTAITTFDIAAIELVEIVPSEFIATVFYNIDEQRHFHNHSPPLLSAQDTYLQNNVFRI